MKRTVRLAAVLLVICMIFSSCAGPQGNSAGSGSSAGTGNSGASSGTSGSQDPSSVAIGSHDPSSADAGSVDYEPIDYSRYVPSSPEDVEPTSVEDFLKAMDLYAQLALSAKDSGLAVLASYYGGYAGASVSSLRYAVENNLWLRGEGEDFEGFVQNSPYAGWDEIASIGYMSPMPYFFEGLVHEVQGENEESLKCYAVAGMMPLFPVEGMNFWYLKDLGIEELYSKRDALLEFENSLYSQCPPVLHGVERCYELGFNGSVLEMAAAAGKQEDFETAYKYSRIALQNDPFDESCWSAACINAMLAGKLYECAIYLEEGLASFPQSARLLAIESYLKQLAEQNGGSK